MRKHIFLIYTLIFVCSCSTLESGPVAQKAPEESNVAPARFQTINPAKDIFWNDMAMHADENSFSIIKVLEDKYPVMLKQMLADALDPLLLSFWGESVNFDSGAKKIIVKDKILQDLESLFHLPSYDQKAHAGVIHTYGYLFSVIETPYGFKRARWIEPTLSRGFGFKEPNLSPFAKDGTLLTNITYFAGKLVFKSAEKLQQLNALKNVANEIFTFDIDRLKKIQIIEKTKLFTLTTTLVPFPKASGDANEFLLIYSHMNETGEEKLITVFPVSNESYNKLVAPENFGANRPISLRYNIYIEGIGPDHKGERKLLK